MIEAIKRELRYTLVNCRNRVMWTLGIYDDHLGVRTWKVFYLVNRKHVCLTWVCPRVSIFTPREWLPTIRADKNLFAIGALGFFLTLFRKRGSLFSNRARGWVE